MVHRVAAGVVNDTFPVGWLSLLAGRTPTEGRWLNQFNGMLSLCVPVGLTAYLVW
jgi:hypothetical protein